MFWGCDPFARNHEAILFGGLLAERTLTARPVLQFCKRLATVAGECGSTGSREQAILAEMAWTPPSSSRNGMTISRFLALSSVATASLISLGGRNDGWGCLQQTIRTRSFDSLAPRLMRGAAVPEASTATVAARTGSSLRPSSFGGTQPPHIQPSQRQYVAAKSSISR